MKVNIENCIKQAARVLRRKGDEGGYAYMLEEELLRHLKELRDAPAKHGEFFALYRFSDGKDPAPQAQEEPSGAPALAVTVPRWAADMGIAAINALENPTATQAAARRVMGEALAQPPAPASPAGLVWTKEKPKVEGWYWVQRLALKPYCVQVIDWMGKLQVEDSWNDKTFEVERFTDDYEWAGPIPEPAAPEAGAHGEKEGGGPV